jgi:hypothetical protein
MSVSTVSAEYIDGLAAYKRGDYKTAFAMWTKAADQGDAKSQFMLGSMYFKGEGVPQAHNQAALWYLKAAEQENASAQAVLGSMYLNGEGVPQDYDQAASWYRKAADQGNADAQFNLGLMYDKGWGVAKDYNQALLWYRKATDQGNTWAQHNLGEMYEVGRGVAQDYNQALFLYRKAADQGNASAQVKLGMMYANGRGVAQDFVEANKWLNVSVAYESNKDLRDTAIRLRDIVAKELTEAQIAEAQKRAMVDPMFHPIVADVIRRVIEWRKETRAVFDKLATQSKNTAQYIKPDEITKTVREKLVFLRLATKYQETMGRLSLYFDENVTKKTPNLPKVAWWEKLKKLFEIEESFYKQAREAFATNDLEDYEIYSGLARESLQQIWDSIEKVDNAAKPVTEKKKLPNLPEVQGLCAKQNIPFVMGHALYTWWQKLKKRSGR